MMNCVFHHLVRIAALVIIGGLGRPEALVEAISVPSSRIEKSPLKSAPTIELCCSRREALTSALSSGGLVSFLLGAGPSLLASPLVVNSMGVNGDEEEENGRIMVGPPSFSQVQVVLESRGDTLGLELVEARIGNNPPRSILAIQSTASSAGETSIRRSVLNDRQRQLLRRGMVCRTYGSLEELRQRVTSGPYPIELVFEDLAAGGDAISDFGTPIVSSQDALNVAKTTPVSPGGSRMSSSTFRITNLKPSLGDTSCPIRSRRDDVLEIVYSARLALSNVEYDSSETRGTGQPYFMVLGSGDMLPGVDQGLYDMCPGEKRRIDIPSPLAYGSRGNEAFRIPPNEDLIWTVELVSIQGLR